MPGAVNTPSARAARAPMGRRARLAAGGGVVLAGPCGGRSPYPALGGEHEVWRHREVLHFSHGSSCKYPILVSGSASAHE
jgi:hypothetical protein